MRTWKEAMSSGGVDSRDNYAGETWVQDWYMVVGQSRDSECLEESNFEAALNMLGGESDTVQIVRFGHWAVGWIEELMVDPKDTESVETAERIQAELENYPVLDEEDFSRRECEYAAEVWTNCYDVKERIELCQEHGISIFAARHSYIPQDDDGSLLEHLVTR